MSVIARYMVPRSVDVVLEPWANPPVRERASGLGCVPEGADS